MSQSVESKVAPSRWVPFFFMVPLILLIAGLGYDQFRREKQAVLADLINLTAEQHYAVNSMIGDADRQLIRMRATMERQVLNRKTEPARDYRDDLKSVDIKIGDHTVKGMELRGRIADNGNIIAVPDLFERPRERQGPLDAALNLLPQLSSEAAASSLSSWSYFFSAAGDFILIRPSASLQQFMNESNAQNPVKSVEDLIKLWLTYDLYLMAKPENNPKGLPYWTDAYMDAAGSGMMISHGIPVSVDGRFLGMVGTDITLSAFSSVLSHMRKPLGFTAILGRKGQILGVEGASFEGQQGQMRALLEASGLTRTTEWSDGTFVETGDLLVLSRPLGTSPFRLLFILPSSELYDHLLPRFAPYTLILAAVAITLFSIFYYLHLNFVMPGLALTEFVRRSVAGAQIQMPQVPKHWRGQLDAIFETFVVARDYRDRLVSSEARYRAVIDTQTELVARMDPRGYATFANEAYCRYYDMTLEEVLNRPDSEFDSVVAEDRERHDAHIHSLSPAQPVSTIVIRSRIPGRDEVRWEEWTDTGLFDDNGNLVEIQCVGRDITDKRLAEQALAESQARFSAFLNYAPVAIISKDRGGRFTMVNPEAANRLGRQPEEIIGRMTVDVLPEAEASVMDQSVERVIKTGQMQLDTQYHPSLAPYLHSLFIRFPLRNSEGEIDGVGVFAVDRTQEVAATEEMARQRDALHQTEKIAALGSLLAGIAHELNNPLAIVVGYAEILAETAEDEETRSRADEIQHAASRCARIVRTFLAMARAKPAERRVADIQELMSEVLELAVYGLRSNGVEVVHDMAGDLPPVFVDADQIHQVFMNVVINAQQAMMSMDDDRRLAIRYRQDEKSIVVEIEDTGIGVTEDVQRRAFDPFFTTKPQGIGTGIGLAVSRNIVIAHGGSIELVPAPERGTICRISLPCMESKPSAEAVGPKDGPVARLSGRILVVDDEPAIAAFLSELMILYGLEVDVARSGWEALDKIRDRPFDAVLTDLRMPDIGGTKLVERILAERPALRGRIVFMTGDALAGEAELKESGLPYLEKPIETSALRAALRTLMFRDDV